jgi:hypothetical protein
VGGVSVIVIETWVDVGDAREELVGLGAMVDEKA